MRLGAAMRAEGSHSCHYPPIADRFRRGTVCSRTEGLVKRATVIFVFALSALLGFAGIAYGKDGATSYCGVPDADLLGSKPGDLQKFEQKIRQSVREKDLGALFSLVRGELAYGPRKAFAKTKNFDDIFSAEWRNKVLEAPCYPVWHRGYGEYWFDLSGILFREYLVEADDKRPHDIKYAGVRYLRQQDIYSIHGALREDFPKPPAPVGWEISEGPIPPQCLAMNCSAGCPPPENSILFSKTPIDLCFDDSHDGRIGGVKRDGKYTLSRFCPSGISDADDCGLRGSLEYGYEVIASVPVEKCQEIAPLSLGKCLASFLIHVWRDTGGSVGPDKNYNIYGLFVSNGKMRYIAPLAEFFTENDAMNYMDTVIRRN